MAHADIDELRFATVPYRKDGRTMDGADCWGFVRLAARSIDIDLPEFNDVTIRDRSACEGFICDETAFWTAVKVGDERPGDVGHMTTVNTSRGSVRLLRLHLGVVTRRGRLMHLEGDAGVQAVPLWHSSVKDRLLGIYRFTDDTRARYDHS